MSGKKKGWEGPRYRRFYVPLFADATFRALTPPQPNAQTLYQYLLLGPHVGRIPGVFTLTRGDLADRLDWSTASLDRYFEELTKVDFAVADWRNRVVYLPKALGFEPPSNVSQLRGFRGYWMELIDCALKTRAANEMRAYFDKHKPWQNFNVVEVADALDYVFAPAESRNLSLVAPETKPDWKAQLWKWFEGEFWPLFPPANDGTKWEVAPAFELLLAAYLKWRKTWTGNSDPVSAFTALLQNGLKLQLAHVKRRKESGKGFVAGWPGFSTWLKTSRWTVAITDEKPQSAEDLAKEFRGETDD